MTTEHGSETTSSAVDLVREFFDAMVATPEGSWRVFEAYFDETSIWENVGVARTVGTKEAVAFARALPFEFDHMRIEELVLDGIGDRVYAERLDHFCTREGTIVLTARVLGVFEIRGRTISHWRDYFDTAALGAFVAAQGR